MAIKELFYDQRPVALLNPRASQRIDPRFKFTRDSTATYVNQEGLIKTVQPNIPRFAYDFTTKEYRGLLLEPTRTNFLPSSVTPPLNGFIGSGSSQTTVTTTLPSGESGIARSITWGPTGDIRARFLVSGTFTGSHIFSVFWKYPTASGWTRYSELANTSGIPGAMFVDLNAASSDVGTYGETVYLAFGQFEAGSTPTSYISNPGSGQTTRLADILSVDSVPIPASGSIFIDARAITTNANDTLLSLKNASNQKINLAMEQRSELYNSLALTYSIKGTVKPTLPYPVPTTNRERNIITWGTNNYQYNTDGARFAPSLSTTPGIPANLTQLSIGHDAVDPTKAFNGYINAVYLYNGEITPTVAEALVRGELDPVNADTYSPVGPTGSLALVINTQGASSTGDKVFALPAESALNDNDIVITWGDGTESGLDGAEAELGAPGLEHTYPSAGIYPIWVEGKLENLQFGNSASAPDLVKIEKWGTTANGNDVFLSPSTMANAFYGCSKLTSMPTSGLPDTSAVTNWYRAFRGCSSLTGTFPSFNFSAATTLQEAFYGCSSLTSFTAAGDQTQNVTNFSYAWYDCPGLTSFPLINTSAGTNFDHAWTGCNSLTSFPLINTSSATNLAYAWAACPSLTSFPLINTSSCTNFSRSWENATGLTAFPLLNTSSGVNFARAWYNNTGLTSFPLLNTSSGTNFEAAWAGCTGLTSFPLIDTSSGTNFFQTWVACSALTSFPLIDTSAGTQFASAWQTCSALTSFPAIDTSSGTNFSRAWYENYGLTAFPSLNFNAATGSASDASNTFTGFRQAWISCTSLADFPAGRFNSTSCTRYQDAFTSCALTAQSIENILVSINAAGTSNGNLGIGGGTNAAKTTWSSAANTAYDALVARGWTITFNA